MNDELRKLYALASRALECQADIGHKEIIVEAREIVSEPALETVTPSPETPLTKTTLKRTAPETAPQKPMDKNSKIEAIPNYGPIPAVIDGDLVPNAESAKGSQFTNLQMHRDAICECTKCELGSTRTKFVYGVGNPKAKIMFVGEAPGKDEDLQGEPFVGRAGKLLDKIIIAMGFKREDIYIANILKCRPPNNRDPQPDEMALCMPYLKEQIRLIKPQFICALGRIAVQGLLDTNTPLGKLRKQWHRFEGIPLIATYHPAALLRFVKYKRDTWEDMQVLLAEYEKMNNGNS